MTAYRRDIKDNGHKSVFTNSWLVRQRNRSWRKGIRQKSTKEWTHSLTAVPFVWGHRTVSPRTPEKHLRVYTSSRTMSRPRVACWHTVLRRPPIGGWKKKVGLNGIRCELVNYLCHINQIFSLISSFNKLISHLKLTFVLAKVVHFVSSFRASSHTENSISVQGRHLAIDIAQTDGTRRWHWHQTLPPWWSPLYPLGLSPGQGTSQSPPAHNGTGYCCARGKIHQQFINELNYLLTTA